MIATQRQQMELALIMPCEDCGNPATFELFGLYFCPEREPRPVDPNELGMIDGVRHRLIPSPQLTVNDWYMSNGEIEHTFQVYRKAMRRIIDSRKMTLEEVKARVLTELKGE